MSPGESQKESACDPIEPRESPDSPAETLESARDPQENPRETKAPRKAQEGSGEPRDRPADLQVGHEVGTGVALGENETQTTKNLERQRLEVRKTN